MNSELLGRVNRWDLTCPALPLMQDVEKAAAAFAKEAGSYGCPTERPTLEAAKPPEPLVEEAAAKKPVERCAVGNHAGYHRW